MMMKKRSNRSVCCAFQFVLPPCGGKRERARRGKMDNRLEKINLLEEAQVDEERYLF